MNKLSLLSLLAFTTFSLLAEEYPSDVPFGSTIPNPVLGISRPPNVLRVLGTEIKTFYHNPANTSYYTANVPQDWYYVGNGYLDFRLVVGISPAPTRYNDHTYYVKFYHFSVFTDCLAGYSANSNGVCTPNTCVSPNIFNEYTGICSAPVVCNSTQHIDIFSNTCVDNTFAYYTGNPDGCHNFGGLYYDDGTCMDPDDWSARFFKSTGSYKTAALAIGGAALVGGAAFVGGVALVSALSTSIASTPFLTSAFLHGTGASVAAYSLYNPDTDIPDSSDSPTTASSAIRVNLLNYKVSNTPDAGGVTVTQTNPTTGKVQTATIVPDSVLTQMQNPSNINPDTREFVTPIDPTGMQTIEYNYEKNIATVTTQTSPTTTTTKSTSITVSQNSDGTVTTIPNTRIAPTVSGSNGGSVTEYNYQPASSSGEGSLGTNNGDGKDYTAVLNDIKTNTKDTSDLLKKILDAFLDGNFSGSLPDGSGQYGDFDGSLSDGSDQFSNFDGEIKNSFSGFVYTDPLGISNIGSSHNVPTYSFSLMGQTYIIFDQNLLNKLPLDLIKNILLFVAAVGGFITVVSFGA